MNTIRGMLAVDLLPGTERHALAEALRAWRWICVKRYGLERVAGVAKRHAEALK